MNPAHLLLLVSAVVLVDTVFFTALIPLLPHYVNTFGLSKTEAGVLVAAYPLGTLIGALPGGVLASRLGVRPAVVLGLCFMSAATLVFGLGTSIVVLDSARFVQGLGGACTWSGGMAWLAAGTPVQRRGSAMGIALGAAVGGALLGPVIGGVASRVGTGPAFDAAAVAGFCIILASFRVGTPTGGESQSLLGALRAVGDRGVAGGMWLTGLAGLSFGVVDVLAPLQLNALGASAFVIAGAFLAAAGLEAVLSTVVGRLVDRRGPLFPVKISVAVAITVSVLLPFLHPAWILVGFLVIGIPAYGTLFVPASALLSAGADRRKLHQGLGFALVNLSWAGGQAVAAASSGAIAQATVDAVPYLLLAGAFTCTFVALQPGGRRALARLGYGDADPDCSAERSVGASGGEDSLGSRQPFGEGDD